MKYMKAITALIAGLTLFKLIYINTFPLLGDEAYYWQWSRHLAPGYYEQGPVLALVIWFFTLFNKVNSVFTIRLGAVVLSALTMIICFFIYRKLYPEDKNRRENFFNLVFISTSIIYEAGSVIMMHDTVMVFFYSLFIYIMLFAVEKPENNKPWILAGITLAAGIMSKYTMAAVYPALIIFLLAVRFPLKNIKGPVLLTVFTAVFLTPVIYWNLTHEFATIKYLFIRGGSDSGFTLKHFGELIGSQAALISVFLVPFMAAALLKEAKTPSLTQRYFLSALFIFTFLPFALLSIFTRVEANWPAFTFLPLFFITTRYIFSLKLRPALFHSLYGISAVILIIIFMHISSPFLPLPAKTHPLKKTWGYKNLAQKADTLYNGFNDQNGLMLATRHYQDASLLSFYMKGQPDFYILLGHESSKNYRFWNEKETLKGKNFLFFWNQPWERNMTAELFSSVIPAGEIETKIQKDKIRRFKVSFCENFVPGTEK